MRTKEFMYTVFSNQYCNYVDAILVTDSQLLLNKTDHDFFIIRIRFFHEAWIHSFIIQLQCNDYVVEIT